MTQDNWKNTKVIAGLLVLLSLLVIFMDVAIAIVDKAIVPITSKVKEDCSTVLVFSILFVIAAYLANGYLIYKKNYLKQPGHSVYLFAIVLAFYTLFRGNDHYIFYGIGKVAYVDVSFATVCILEILSYFIPVNRRKIPNASEIGFVSDNPSRIDEIGRKDYAELLIGKICSSYKSGSLGEGSMTILLNERFGAGKTTFFYLLEDSAKGKLRTCVFKPWQTSDGEGIIQELLKLLEEQYAISSQLGKQLEGYSKLLAGSKAKNVLDFVSHLLNERNSLARRYELIKKILKNINDPLIVFVDDVDRLQAEELLSLLKLLRDAADFPNIIYIVAADKEAMSQMLAIKGIKDADEYLKKFFNFELLFPMDDSYLSSLLKEQVENTLTYFYGTKYSINTIEKEILSAQYVRSVFNSPRDVYRFINLLSYSLDLFKRFNVLEDVHISDLLKLLIIQFISPMVYKILRDEMDLLFDVKGDEGRIHLKDGYKEIIISRQRKKELEDLKEHVRIKTSQQVTSNDIADEVDDMTLFDIPVRERPNNEDIVSDLLRDMFYDTLNYQTKDRICYLAEYFKFFAGKYSKRELSSQYMKDLMELPSEAKFEETMNLAINQGKAEFMVHKLKQYIEDKTINKDIPYVLKRCIMIQDAVYRDWAKKQSFGKDPIDYLQIDQFHVVYMNLLIVDKKGIITDLQEIERVKALYAENNLYIWLAASLKLPIDVNHDMLFVYGQELHIKLKENLIRRFITEELSETPFEINKIKTIPMLKSMHRAYWDEQFKKYVSDSPEPMAWLYILLKPSGDLLAWNYEYYHNLVEESTLYSYASDIIGFDISQELSSDLHEVSGMHNGAALSSANFSHHPFLVEARKWWDARNEKK